MFQPGSSASKEEHVFSLRITGGSMKRTGLVLLLAFAMVSVGQQTSPPQPAQAQAQKTTQRATNINIGSAPTAADMYCSGFITTEKVSDSRYVAAGISSPEQTHLASAGEIIYIHGHDMKEGDRFQILRHVKDVNHYESYKGQKAAIREAGEPYFELGRVRVGDGQKETADAVPELSCGDFVMGDGAIPFVERQAPVFRAVTLDRLAAPNGKTVGRIIMANEFDTFVGSKNAVYLSVGEDKGIKVGDYLRATRTYSYSYRDHQGVLSRRASETEDNQKKPQKLPLNELSSLPRLTLGDMVVLQVHKKSSTALILTALEDIHVGDGVEVMDVSAAPEVRPVQSISTPEPGPSAAATDTSVASPPRITCSASPATVRVGESSTITCDASSPDNRPLALTFVTNGGRLSTSRNQATLDTAGIGAGPIAVRATAFDDRQLSATAVTTANVESATPPPLPNAQKLSELEFKPGSAHVDNRSKAVLDDVALKLQQDPASTAVLSGSADEKEPPRMASQRAENAKTYLSKSKGIDAQRLQTKTSSDPGRTVQIWTVPAGASAPK